MFQILTPRCLPTPSAPLRKSTGLVATIRRLRPSARSFGGLQRPGLPQRLSSPARHVQPEPSRRRLRVGSPALDRPPNARLGNEQRRRGCFLVDRRLFARLTSLSEQLLRRQAMPPRHFANGSALRANFRDNGRLPIHAPRSPTARARKDLDPPRRRPIKLRHVFEMDMSRSPLSLRLSLPMLRKTGGARTPATLCLGFCSAALGRGWRRCSRDVVIVYR